MTETSAVARPRDFSAAMANPEAFRAELIAWLPEAPGDEIVATRDELVDIAAYVKRKDAGALLEVLRCARVTEWHMAHRWPVKEGTGRRGDDRPLLGASGKQNQEAWDRVYDVGRADLDRLLTETDPLELSQAAVIAWTAAAAQGGAHVANNSGENEWYTPSTILHAARDVMGAIDVDPASSDIAQRTAQAATYYTADDDGLAHDWPGAVWLNPPYSQPLVDHFTERLLDQLAANITTQAITLTNNATETRWGAALLRAAGAACFPVGRIRFIDPDGNPGAPLQGQMLTYHGPHRDRFRERFAAWGPVMIRG